MIVTLIVFIAVLSLLVFVHEFGHYWTARKLGVKVDEFGFGFPPRAWGIYRKADGGWKQIRGNGEVTDAAGTIYSLNWLPLGGFCKIKGENGEGENDPDSFAAKKIWRRVAIISAGVIMNVVLAAVLLSIGYMIGLPQSLDETGGKAIVKNRQVQIIQILPDTPAAKAGVKEGDVILDIDGQKFSDYAELQKYVNARAGSELSYQIKRGKNILDLKITPNNNNGKGEIGVGIINTGLVRYPWYIALWKGSAMALSLLWLIIVAFFELIKGLFLGQGLTAEVAGPVGIANMTGQYARLGVAYLLQFTALLSLNLAVINFLPFPALDGGRIIFLTIEKIKGSPVKREVENAIHNIGFFFLIFLVLLVTVKDVSRFGSFFKALWLKIF